TMGPVTDPIGVVKVAKGQSVTIAYWLVVAGPDASLGVDSRRGIEIAIDDKKAIMGFPIKLIGEDSGCNAEGGVTAATKLASIHDGSPYAEGLANAFADNFKKLGGTITSQEAIAPTDTDMRPVLTKIASGKPDLIYYPIFIAAGGFVTRQAKEVAGLQNVKLMSADGTFSPDFYKAGGDAVIGMYHTSPDLSEKALGT